MTPLCKLRICACHSLFFSYHKKKLHEKLMSDFPKQRAPGLQSSKDDTGLNL